MSKGSRRRPQQVSNEVLDRNWQLAFGKQTETTVTASDIFPWLPPNHPNLILVSPQPPACISPPEPR
jgi:hypothetical protein